MSWVAVAVGGAAVLGAVISDQASQRAASAQDNAANNANSLQQNEYNQARSDQGAYRSAGVNALNQIQAQQGDTNRSFSMADFQNDPGYQFRLDEGQKAIERSAAARGGLNSGATLQALSTFGQGQAAQEYQGAYDRFNNDRSQRFNRLASVAGLGQTATQSTSMAGMNSANQIGSNTLGAGNANAAANIAQGNAYNGAIGQGINTWQQYQLANRYGNVAPPLQQSSMGSQYGSAPSYSLGANTTF